MAEVTNSFSPDDVAWPFCGNETVELVYIECRAAVIDKSPDTIFFYFTTFGVMMVMMMVLVLVLFLFMFVFIFMMVVLMSFGFIFFLFGSLTLYFSNPSCLSCYAFKIEHFRMYNFIEVNIGIIAFDNFGSGL